ncbi:MAG: hypothetical protein ABJC62_14295 [Frankiaceae bacterium]
MRADIVAALLAAPASVRISPAKVKVPAGTPRCYLGDGRSVLWASGGALRCAVDAEIAGRSVPRALARRYGAEPARFWPRWTAVEVVCKLRNVPLPVWLRQHGLVPDPDLAVRTFRLADLVVSCGAAEAGPYTRLASRRAISIARCR